jgi:hypothetical protein
LRRAIAQLDVEALDRLAPAMVDDMEREVAGAGRAQAKTAGVEQRRVRDSS